MVWGIFRLAIRLLLSGTSKQLMPLINAVDPSLRQRKIPINQSINQEGGGGEEREREREREREKEKESVCVCVCGACSAQTLINPILLPTNPPARPPAQPPTLILSTIPPAHFPSLQLSSIGLSTNQPLILPFFLSPSNMGPRLLSFLLLPAVKKGKNPAAGSVCRITSPASKGLVHDGRRIIWRGACRRRRGWGGCGGGCGCSTQSPVLG